MRTPLIRQGGGQQALNDLIENRAEQRRQLDRMIATANATPTQQDQRRRGIIAFRSPAGDEQRLRGIPICAQGITGAIPGTRPGANLR